MAHYAGMRIRTLIVAGLLLAFPPASHAATASVTNAEGADVQLTAPTTVATMAPTVKLAFGPTERRYSVRIAGPAGTDAVQPVACLNVSEYADLKPTYQGNGTYTVAVTTTTDAGDLSCAAGQTITYQYGVAAGATVGAPRGGLLTRRGERALEHAFAVTATAGTDVIELAVARGARPQADGSLPRARTVSVSAERKSADITFDRPGRYAVVARPRRGDAAGPWSAPVYVDVSAPFDLAAAPAFKDASGPRYVVTGNVRPAVPRRSKIRVYVAQGKQGGKFRKLKTVRTRRGGRFKLRFRTEDTGNFRLQYRFGGTDRVARGRVTAAVRLVRARA